MARKVRAVWQVGGKARQRYPSQRTLTTRRACGFGILDQ
jgi:hypothetical protein